MPPSGINVRAFVPPKVYSRGGGDNDMERAAVGEGHGQVFLIYVELRRIHPFGSKTPK